jgi:hypothetical protein
MEWSFPWMIGSVISLLVLSLNVLLRLTGKPGALATCGRFFRWCVSRPALEIDLAACRQLVEAQQRAMDIQRSIGEMRNPNSASGIGSVSGSGESKAVTSPTSPTTPPLSMPSGLIEPGS